MSYLIDVQADERFPVDVVGLRTAATVTLRLQRAAANAELTIVITDDATIARLNAQYRDIDAPTDVLSFPADPLPPEMQGEPRYIGDIIIAYPYAREQALREGHAIDDSLRLLVVHGTLHLLGFDHDTVADRATMWATQQAILAELAIPLDIVPTLESYQDEEADETDHRGPHRDHED
jgi:probable rRNA maturation factor